MTDHPLVPAASMRSQPRVSIVVGGVVGDARSAIRDADRPRIDVLELAPRLSARVFDFQGLQQSTTAWARTGRQVAQRGQWSVGLALDVMSQIRDDDVIYATGEDVAYPLAALMQLRRRRRPRVVMRLEEPSYGRSALRRSLYGLHRANALRHIDVVLCRTRAHFNYLHAVERVPSEKLQVVGETVDPRFYSPELVRPGDAPPEMPSTPFILSAGLERRDYDTLVEATRGMPMHLVIGAGSPWSHSTYGRSELPSNVFCASFTPRQMRALYASAAMVVVPVRPTLRACGMNVVLEAWAMGKAVVATRTSGLVDYIKESETGFLVEPYDAGSMRRAIEDLLESPDVADEIGRRGRVEVASTRNLDCYVATVASVVEAVAGRARR